METLKILSSVFLEVDLPSNKRFLSGFLFCCLLGKFRQVHELVADQAMWKFCFHQVTDNEDDANDPIRSILLN